MARIEITVCDDCGHHSRHLGRFEGADVNNERFEKAYCGRCLETRITCWAWGVEMKIKELYKILTVNVIEKPVEDEQR